MRLNLGMEYHVELHRRRLLSGKTMTAQVEEALDLYFKHRPPEARAGNA